MRKIDNYLIGYSKGLLLMSKIKSTPADKMPFQKSILFLFCCSLMLLPLPARAKDWPTYRHDIARTAATREKISPPLFLNWKFQPAHTPKPAWPMPGEELPRMHTDSACHVAIVRGSVYFASSVTNKVYSIDADTGKIAWTFFAQGPVRFTPTVSDNRLYFGSDDGYVYCLNAKNGELLWKYRAGPSEEKVIGNSRLISLWPVRTSVLVDNNIAYFAAGVFPYEGIYVCALNATNGLVIWKNDTVGDRAHELDFGGISPHGYLVASEDVLYVPSGRAMPAAFDRKTGQFIAFLSVGGKRGGTWALLDKENLIAGVDYSGTPHKVAYDTKTQERKAAAFAWFPGIDIVPTSDVSYVLTLDGIYAVNRNAYAQADSQNAPIAEKQKKLRDRLSQLRRRSRNADELTKKQINEEIEQITAQLTELDAEHKKLRDTTFRWHYSAEGLASLLLANDTLIAGGENDIVVIDTQTGRQLWQADTDGNVVALAAANGKLVAGTDKGEILCFTEKNTPHPTEIKTQLIQNPYADSPYAELYRTAAKNILNRIETDKGYCLVLDCGQGQLAYELAKRTNFKIVGIETDKINLAVARQKLEAAHLLGDRVVIEPWDISDLPKYFANLIISDGMLLTGETTASDEQINRLLRPYGGVALLGKKKSSGNEISWTKTIRGSLEGAGAWTHQYADPQNTACSDDKLVRDRLGVLWFGQPGSESMVERHARAASPVSMNGRLFVQGEELIMAYDAYNGTFLWQTEIPGAVRVRVDVDSGNLALSQDALYVAAYDKCSRLDPATGNIMQSYELPLAENNENLRWGYIACVDNILLTVAANPLRQEYAATYKEEYRSNDLLETVKKEYKRRGTDWRYVASFPSWGSQRSPKDTITDRIMAGDYLCALDTRTGQKLWQYNGKDIANISVTIDDGIVFFVDSRVTDDQRTAALNERNRLAGEKIYIPPENILAQLDGAMADVRLAVAVDLKAGAVLWKKPIDLSGCGGDKMGSAAKDGVLLFFGHFSNHDTGFFKNNELTWRRITALNADTGDIIWSKPLNYLRRPLIIGDKIIIEPRACDLRTGQIFTRKDPITGLDTPWEFLRPGHCCAITSASAEMMFYRSYNAAMYDFANDKGVSLFGAIRPGCWLNMIPANGLMLMPEASAGCTCSFPLRSSLAMIAKPEKEASNWTVFVNHGDMTPVKHFAINFGAPGDMRADDGTLWFAYPRPKAYSRIGYGNYGVKFDLKEEIIDQMGPYCSDYRAANIKNSDKTWLFTSGYKGLLSLTMPLLNADQEQKKTPYTIRLGFKALPEDRPGSRVFDVLLNDKLALEQFDIIQTAQNNDAIVVKEFTNVPVTDNLKVSFVPKKQNCTADQAPIISFIEVIRETPETDKIASNL
jgi:outer membrane protein assembly factor BamB